MKKKYEKPELIVINFENDDIIAESTAGTGALYGQTGDDFQDIE